MNDETYVNIFIGVIIGLIILTSYYKENMQITLGALGIFTSSSILCYQLIKSNKKEVN